MVSATPLCVHLYHVLKLPDERDWGGGVLSGFINEAIVIIVVIIVMVVGVVV